jgi:hypothetical protein
MKILLSSFGLAENSNKASLSPFYLMPPMRSMNNSIMPDYSALLLFNTVVMDVNSFQFVMEWSERLTAYFYERKKTLKLPTTEKEVLLKSAQMYADTFRLLKEEGFVELVDFNAILGPHKSLLKKILDYDMSNRDLWLKPLKKSLGIWDRFARDVPVLIAPNYLSAHSARTDAATIRRNLFLREELFKKATDPRDREDNQNILDELESIIREYLKYVNCNLVLSNLLSIPFHDWEDYSPFYEQKFLSVGRIGFETQKEQSLARQLFQISFPEFAITDPHTFMKIITDKRINDLRKMIKTAAENDSVFDVSFARNTLKKVLDVEQKTAKYRSIVSWITKPIDFIPWAGNLASTIVDEVAGHIVDGRIKRDFRWFYLLSDIAETDA